MQFIQYQKHQAIPVIAEPEICVVGAGPGGLGAAVAAARSGRDVLLVERYGAPGGMAFYGEVTPFMPNHLHGRPLDGPLYGEWLTAMGRYTRPDQQEDIPDWAEEGNLRRRIEKDAAMLSAEEMLLDAGVRLLYHHTLLDVVRREDSIDYIVVASKSGLAAIRAEIFIDSTGDGDLAVLAGCPGESGNEDGFCQPMTLCFKLEHVEIDRMPPREVLNQLYDEAKERGEVENPRENVLFFFTTEPDVLHFNTTRIVRKSGVSGLELSEAEIEGRKQLRMMYHFLRRHVPGFEHAQIRSIGHQIGVRESRRIIGKYYLTEADFETRRKFPDSIARVCYSIDIHNPQGSGTRIRTQGPGEWYEIPYGCIVPDGVDNLLVAGRGISVDHAIHSSMRIMPVVLSIGQAAGIAAVAALEKGLRPMDLDGNEVHRRLILFGAVL